MADPKLKDAPNPDDQTEDEEIVDGPDDAIGDESDDPEADAGDGDAGDGDESGGAVDDLIDNAPGADEGRKGGQDQVRQPSRAERRIRALNEDTKAAREEAAAARREAAELRALVSGRQTDEQRRAEADRRALMSPDERHEDDLKRLETRLGNELGTLKFQSWDSSDRSSFEAKCARNPALAAVADQVEQTLKSERAAGRGVISREMLAEWCIGHNALANGGRHKATQTKKAAEARQRQQARPGSSRSDVAGGRERSSDKSARNKRVESYDL